MSKWGLRYREGKSFLTWKEQFIYGSSRLGTFLTDKNLDKNTKTPYFVTHNTIKIGRKRYELSNHLGNVLSVVSDIRKTTGGAGDQIATIISAKDYYLFGLEIPVRDYQSSIAVFGNDYRFGFNDERAIPQGECLGDIQASEP